MVFGPAVLDKFQRIIFPQWMPFPIQRQKNAPQIRMVVKFHTNAHTLVTLSTPPPFVATFKRTRSFAAIEYKL